MRAELARPVDRDAPLAELAAELGDRRVGRVARVLAGLDRVVLGGQAERVVAHRVQHAPAGAPVEVRDRVAHRVDLQVADVRLAARVREHHEHVGVRRPARRRRWRPPRSARRPTPAASGARSASGRSGARPSRAEDRVARRGDSVPARSARTGAYIRACRNVTSRRPPRTSRTSSSPRRRPPSSCACRPSAACRRASPRANGRPSCASRPPRPRRWRSSSPRRSRPRRCSPRPRRRPRSREARPARGARDRRRGERRGARGAARRHRAVRPPARAVGLAARELRAAAARHPPRARRDDGAPGPGEPGAGRGTRSTCREFHPGRR